jgi:hypothetical protein
VHGGEPTNEQTVLTMYQQDQRIPQDTRRQRSTEQAVIFGTASDLDIKIVDP